MSIASHLFAAIIATVAWAGIALYGQAQLTTSGSLPTTIWTLLFYFTILANLAVAIVFTGIALGASAFAGPRLLAGLALSMTLVGVVYGLLLSGIAHLTAGSEVANWLLHRIGPVLVPLFWLIFVPKGRLEFRDALLWTLFPLAYVVYALIRGSLELHYPYPFMDVAALGWGTALFNILLIAVGFVLSGCLLVLLDRALARR